MFQSVVNHFANQFSGQTLLHQARNRGVSVVIVVWNQYRHLDKFGKASRRVVYEHPLEI